jgi:hypothetical protein
MLAENSWFYRDFCYQISDPDTPSESTPSPRVPLRRGGTQAWRGRSFLSSQRSKSEDDARARREEGLPRDISSEGDSPRGKLVSGDANTGVGIYVRLQPPPRELSPAKIGDKLTTRNFSLGTRSFAASEEKYFAVCVLPKTELPFADELRRESPWCPWGEGQI